MEELQGAKLVEWEWQTAPNEGISHGKSLPEPIRKYQAGHRDKNVT